MPYSAKIISTDSFIVEGHVHTNFTVYKKPVLILLICMVCVCVCVHDLGCACEVLMRLYIVKAHKTTYLQCTMCTVSINSLFLKLSYT